MEVLEVLFLMTRRQMFTRLLTRPRWILQYGSGEVYTCIVN